MESDRLRVLEDNIQSSISLLLKRQRCEWCKRPSRPVYRKGLCSSCYGWYKEQRDLAKRVDDLPVRVPKDPHFSLRHELDVANCAVELCKIEGEVIEDRLAQTDVVDLENEFDALARKLLGSKKGSTLFDRHAEYFYDFSPLQRRWLWYLLALLTNEVNHRDRRRLARRRLISLTNRDLDPPSFP